MLEITFVRSLSLLCKRADWCEGLIAGGGTSRTSIIMLSGLESLGWNPIAAMSSSCIRLKIISMSSAPIVIVSVVLSSSPFVEPPSTPSNVRSIDIRMNLSLTNCFVMRVGCRAPHPCGFAFPQRDFTTEDLDMSFISASNRRWPWRRMTGTISG